MKFCRNVLGVTLMVTTHKENHSLALSAGGHFGLRLLFMYVPMFLENIPIFSHETLCRCSWYTLTVITLFFFHIISLWGSFWCMFLYFLRIVRYFLIKFCIDICSTTRMVTTLKFFIHIIYFSVGGYSGVFLDQLF